MRAPSAMGVLAVFVAGVLTAGAAPAVAAPSPGDAREVAEMARRSYNLGRWLEAIDGFERAYQMTGDPALLFNLAQAHRQLDHVPEALRFYRSYLRERPNGPDRVVAQEQIAELERRRPPPVHAPAAPPESVSAPAPVPPATVIVPPPAPLPPPEPAPAQPPTGELAPPPAAVAAAAPAAPVATTVATASAVSPAVPPEPPLPRWVPWAGAGLTVALATTAAVVGLSSNRRFDELASSCGQTSAGCASADIDAVKSRTRTANILWAAAGALAIATGVGVYVNTREAGVSGLVRF